MDTTMNIYTGIDSDLHADNNPTNATVHLEDCTVFATDKYCQEKCEYYNSCFGESDMCLKKVFEEVLDSLTEREANVLKLSFGYTGVVESLEEIGKKHDISEERIRQIQAKALRKLRHPSRSKRLYSYMYDVFSIQQENFYYRLLHAVFGLEEAGLSEFKLGIDLMVVDKEKCAKKSPAFIKKELNNNIEEIAPLQPYTKYISQDKHITLNQLLHSSERQFNLSVFENDDIAFFGFVKAIYDLGYRFKFLKPNKMVQDDFSKKIRERIVEPEIFNEQILDLSLETTLKLLEHKIFNVEGLLNNISVLKAAHTFPEAMLTEIDDFLLLNNLAMKMENKEILYLSANNLYTFSERFVMWMSQNGNSIGAFLSDLEQNNTSSLEVIQYIHTNFPDYIKQISLDFAVGLIDELDFSVRTYNCLVRGGIHTIEDLLNLSLEDFFEIRNLGRRSIEEIYSKLALTGLLVQSKLSEEDMESFRGTLSE